MLLTAAATITWTGGSTTSSNWSDPANWDLNRAPIDGDSLVFPGSAQRLANNDDISGLSVNSISFQGTFSTSSGYTLSGDDLSVGAGGIVNDVYSGGTTIADQIDLNLGLAAAQNWSVYGLLTINGSVANGGFTLAATDPGTLDFAGPISGSGGLAVTDTQGSAPTVELLNTNTYTGLTSVQWGTLIVNGSTAAASDVFVSSDGTLGGTGSVGGKITVWSAGGPAADTMPAGTLDPGSGPNLSGDTGTLTNTGGVFFQPNPIVTPQSGNSPQSSGAAQFNVQLGGTAANPTSDQLVSAGTVSLLDSTLNLTALSGAGPFNVGQQFVIIQAGAPIANTFDGLPEGSTVSDGTQNFTISYANDKVTLTALATGTLTWTGNSTTSDNWSDPANWNLNRAPVNGDSLVFPAGAKQLANNDDIPGLSVQSLTFQGQFDHASGGYTLRGDSLTLGSGGIVDLSIPFLPPLVSPGVTAGYGYSLQIDLNLTLSAAQSWSVDNYGGHDLVINGDVDNGGFELTAVRGGPLDFAGPISGSGGLAVSGATGLSPTVELQSTNTYTGPTSISLGTLIVNGSTAAASTVTVGNGGTLGGVGTVGGKITFIVGGAVGMSAGTLDPGPGPDLSHETGTLSNTGGVSVQLVPSVSANASDAQFAMQLGGTAANPASDQLDSAGTVAIGGATLDLTALSGAGPFNAGQQFVIVQAGAPITTTFDSLPEGSTVSDGVQNFTISYVNDRVTLTAQAVAGYLNGQTGDGTAATFVQNLYRELLGREPDTAGQAFWVNLFTQIGASGGTAAAQHTLVADFLGSTEYRQHLVEGIYANLLHRAADTGGLTFWTAELAAGLDEKNVLAYIAGSQEYFSDAGSTVQGWVGALYQDLLGRAADPDGLAFWTQVAEGPTGISGQPSPPRSSVAFLFLSTPEANHKLLNANYPGAAGSVGAPGTPADGAYALADITGNGWDNLYFQGNLSAAVVDSLFAQLQAGESYDQAIAGMLEMPQYLGPLGLT